MNDWEKLENDMTDMIDHMSVDEWKKLIDNAPDASYYAKLYGFDEQDGLAAIFYHILGGSNERLGQTIRED